MNKSQRIGIDLGERKVLADNFFVWPGRSDIPALARRRRVRRASPTRLPVSRPQRPRLRCDVHIAIHRSIVRDDCESVLGRPSWSGVLVTGPFGSAYKRNLSMTLITKAQTEQLLTIGLAQRAAIDRQDGSGASADFRPEEGRHRADDGISRNIDPHNINDLETAHIATGRVRGRR